MHLQVLEAAVFYQPITLIAGSTRTACLLP